MSKPSKHLKPLWRGFYYFPHQVEGIQWMLDKELNGILVPDRDGKLNTKIYGGLQCDDMGLGKTIQIVSIIINNPCKDTLLLAPLAMLDTWSGVLSRSGCSVYHLTDTGRSKGDVQWQLLNFDGPMAPRKTRVAVYVTNYEKLYHKELHFRREWDRVVLDEAHKIRNGNGEIARCCRKIIAPLRWAVTGTPLVNSLKDVVSLLAFLGVPYSRLWRWEKRYLPLLPNILIHRSLDSLRLTIKDAPPIPDVTYVELPFATAEEEEFYYGVQGATESMAKKYKSDLLSGAMAFKILIRLRQMSVHPQVYINATRREKGHHYIRPDWLAPSTKLHKIREIIETDDSVRTHKYIVFCQFHDEMTLISNYLLRNTAIADENIFIYNGSMTQKERGNVLARSKASSKTTVLLLQLQAGGVGLNLQEYDRIIFVSPWWTSAMMDQAVARAVRMGQKKLVKVWHLRLSAENEGTIDIDSLINAKAEEKREMLKNLFSMCDN